MNTKFMVGWQEDQSNFTSASLTFCLWMFHFLNFLSGNILTATIFYNFYQNPPYNNCKEKIFNSKNELLKLLNQLHRSITWEEKTTSNNFK